MPSNRTVSRTPSQPRYEPTHHFLKSNVNPSHSIFPVFQLPDELILSILSYISPDPRLSNRYTRLSTSCRLRIRYWRYERESFLRPLSMTCRAMRLRLLPWIWEYPVIFELHTWTVKQKIEVRLNNIASAFRADALLATSVR